MIENLVKGLNPQQAKAVLNPCKSCTKIVAGAGTGKTKIISKRFTKLVLELENEGIKNAAQNILVITFTDKAAGEMKGRIISELENTGAGTGNQDLWISTFHSFCSRILKKHSIDAGLSPSFKLAEESTLATIYENILKRIRYGEIDQIKDIGRICEKLDINEEILGIESLKNLAQLDDIDSILDQVAEIIKKIKSLGLTPEEFYEKSVNSLSRLCTVLENTPFKFESKEDYAQFWAEHFRDYTDDFPDFNTKVFDDIAGYKVILDKFGKRKATEYGYAQGFPENLNKIREIEIHLTKLVALIYAIYQNELERADLADFDDLINKTITILKENPLIRAYYQDYFKHIIIDEFQDTNGAQLELIELLLNPDAPNLTFVGDRKQSIYGFRHAVMENLEVLHKDVEKRYARSFEPINLSLNYRSTSEVLDAVNFVTENELGLEKEKIFAGIDRPPCPDNVFVTEIKGFENAHEQKISEAEYIAGEILKLKSRDGADFKDFAILVKSHAQADLLEKYLKKSGIPALKKVNTGYFASPVIKNALALLRLAGNINDELAFMRVLKIYFNEAEIYRFKTAMDTALLEEMEFEELKKLNLVQKYFNAAQKLEKRGISEFSSRLFGAVKAARSESDNLLELFYKLVFEIKPYPALDEFGLYKAQNELLVFEKIIADFMQTNDYVSAAAFLDYVERIANDKSFELPAIAAKEPDAVQILTIHASKGLEFDYVFVCAISSVSRTFGGSALMTFDMQFGEKPGFGLILNKFNDKITPQAALYKELWKKPRDEAEALRLFYVAVSRAKKYLNVLSFEPFGNNGSIKPAAYIADLGDFLVKDLPIFG